NSTLALPAERITGACGFLRGARGNQFTVQVSLNKVAGCRSVKHSLLDTADGGEGNISEIFLLHPGVSGQFLRGDITRVKQRHPYHQITGKSNRPGKHSQVIFQITKDIPSD